MSSAPQIITSDLPRQLSDQGPDGTGLGRTAADLVYFYGAPAVAQNTTAAGNTHAPITGATTAVFTNTAFDGGITGLNYTIGDLVAILKTVGLIKS